MKKNLTLCCLVLLAGGISAQRTSLAPRQHKMGAVQQVKDNFGPNAALIAAAKAAGGDVVFYDDMANGLAGNNGVGPWTTAGPNGMVWQYDTDGPNGDFSSTAQRIQSTTFANGFMIFDSNLSNNGCVPTNSCVVLDGYLVSPVLDLSATPNCFIAFEERLRWCCSAAPGHFVDVSTDGGTTWPTRFTIPTNVAVNKDIVTNEDIGTHLRRFNLANAISADPTNVRIRFAHEGTTSGNITHYFWQVDDVSIIESYDSDTRLITADIDDYILDGFSTNLEYSVYPFSQLRELNMRARLTNEGALVANNVTLTVDVDNGGGSVFNQSASLPSMAPTAVDSILVNGFTPAMTAADYTVAFTLSADSADGFPSDNIAEKTFSVDPFIYAYDRGARDDYNENEGSAYRVGNTFYIENDVDLYAIDVCLSRSVQQSPATQIGAIVDAQILDANLDFVEATEEFTVTANNQLTGANGAVWITLKFANPVPLNAGEEYVAVLEHFGGSLNVVSAASGVSIPFVSLLYDAPVDTWFYVTATPMVRLNFDPSVGIAESDRQNGVGLGQNFPNPTNGNTVIRYDLERSANVRLEVRDLSGKLVLDRAEGNRGAGVHSIELDTRILSEGAYTYTLTAGDVRLTKRMMVTR